MGWFFSCLAQRGDGSPPRLQSCRRPPQSRWASRAVCPVVKEDFMSCIVFLFVASKIKIIFFNFIFFYIFFSFFLILTLFSHFSHFFHLSVYVENQLILHLFTCFYFMSHRTSTRIFIRNQFEFYDKNSQTGGPAKPLRNSHSTTHYLLSQLKNNTFSFQSFLVGKLTKKS